MNANDDVTKIRAALELLRVPRPKQRRKHSWIKGSLETDAGGMCIMGALYRVNATGVRSEDEYRSDGKAIRKVIQDQYPEYHPWVRSTASCIPNFNDARGRSFEEVEAIMEKAAILREEEGAKSVWTSE